MRRRAALRRWGSTISALGALACDAGSRAAPAPSASLPPAASRSAAPVASVPREAKPPPARAGRPADEVELLSAGARPRRRLRYALKRGSSQTVDVVMGSTMRMKIGKTVEPPRTMPDVRLRMKVLVRSVDAAGTAERRISIESVGLDGASETGGPRAPAGVERQMQQLVGLVGTDEISSRGLLLGASLDVSSIRDPQLRKMMDSTRRTLAQMGVVLPAEAVGVGARWRTTSEVGQLGVELRQVATYELVRLDGRKGTMKVRLRQKAPRGAIRVPGLPKDASSELVGLESKGNGDIDFDLTRSVPRGSLRMKIRSKARGRVRGRMHDIVTKLSYRARFEPEG